MLKESKQWLTMILVAYSVLGMLYALTTPAFEASDELWHYPMIRHLADGNSLPVQVFDPALAGPWKQEASQPPLYYYLGAALTFWIDTSDMERVRWENPHVDNGVITFDGNINLIVHDPSLSPWRGTLLAVRIVRLFSVLLGGITVFFTYRLAQLTIPERQDVVVGGTAVIAFIPMFLFISGAVNNDNLIIPLATVTLWMLVGLVKSEKLKVKSEKGRLGIKDWRLILRNPSLITYHISLFTLYCILLGLIIGLAALTKISGVGLLPLVWGTFVIHEWQRGGRVMTWQTLLRWMGRATLWFLLVFAVAFLVAGWWYIRNVQLYDDWRGWSAFIAVLGQRAHPASLRQLWAERWGFMLSFWGLFGGVNVPMPLWIYHLLNGVLVTAVIGFVPFTLKKIRDWGLGIGNWGSVAESHTNTVTPQRSNPLYSLLSTLFCLVERYFGYVISLLWAGAVVYGIVDWATITWSSQGRLVFSALPSLVTLLVSGLVGWLPRRYGQWVVGGFAGFLFLVALLAPFLWIRSSYQPAIQAAAVHSDAVAQFGETVQLLDYAVILPDEGETAVSPNDTIWLETTWQLLAETDRNWSVFVHLNDPVIGQPIAQRDMYLGQGLVATSFLEPGDVITNRYVLRVPQTAVTPADLDLVIGLYDFNTFERLPLAEGDSFLLDTVALSAVSEGVPNQTAVNFEDEIELLGYDIAERRVGQGETIALTLFVAGKRPLTNNYTFFAQLVDDDTTRWASQDLAPVVPTSQWQPNELQQIELLLPVQDDTPADVFPIIIGMYTATEENPFERLQIITEDGRPTDDFLRLTLVRVE